MKWLIGVDEAGRGPLAGPVAVGVAAVPIDFDWTLLPGVGDSKQVPEKNRELIFRRAKDLKINFVVCQTSASVIDKKGIVKAVSLAMEKALNKLGINPVDCVVRLDGSLRAPSIYTNQITIIGGDALEPVIGLASIMAKVTRDRYMSRLAKKSELSIYDFATHKGYGTLGHRNLIKKYGLSAIHRHSFCRNIQTVESVV